MTWVERHIRAIRFQHRQQTCNEFDGCFSTKPHAHIGANTAHDQLGRKPSSTTIQGFECDRGLAATNGCPLRKTRDLKVPELQYGLRRKLPTLATRPPIRTVQIEIEQPHLGIRADLLRACTQGLRHSFHRRRSIEDSLPHT